MLLEIASNAVRKTQIEVSIPDNIILPAFKLCIFSQNSGEPKAEKESLAITWGLAIDSVIRGTVFPSLSGTCSVIIVGIREIQMHAKELSLHLAGKMNLK